VGYFKVDQEKVNFINKKAATRNRNKLYEEEYMAVPKRRISSTRRDKRRTHFKIKPSAPAVCAHCKQPKAAHRVCKNCGYYAGVEVVQPEE
jgi:large subunit ribosomal protein L32